jgi:hypothetical protein
MTASILSPLASPFQPSLSMMAIDDYGAIYSDGVPTAIAVGGEYEILHNIQDEAIDEAFPPSAEEAAELEAVENFIDILATLSLLEEREEAARESFVGVHKRWSARRKDGLINHPRSPKHIVRHVDHGKLSNPIKATDLVPYDHMAHSMAMASLESRERSRGNVENRAATRSHKNAGKMQRTTVHQPRKHN